jgi:hypothetical protein
MKFPTAQLALKQRNYPPNQARDLRPCDHSRRLGVVGMLNVNYRALDLSPSLEASSNPKLSKEEVTSKNEATSSSVLLSLAC